MIEKPIYIGMTYILYIIFFRDDNILKNYCVSTKRGQIGYIYIYIYIYINIYKYMYTFANATLGLVK